MIKDEQWPVARLIPISSASGVEAQERRAASALLAVIGAVPEFGRALFKPLGAPAGRFESFIEVPFKVNGKSVRPDGIVAVTRGGKTWGALIEIKVGAAQLEPDQLDAYLDLARELDFDAVLTISNQFVTSSTAYPIDVDRRKLRKVALHHWSWVSVLTQAVVQSDHRGVSDPDQAYILNELIRYLSDSRSGAVALESMGPSWTRIREGARDATLRKGDPEVAAVTARWDDLIRYLGLELTKRLGRDVKQVLGASDASPAARQASLNEALATDGCLTAELQIPDAVGTLRVIADLRSRQVTASSVIDSPREGGSKRRVSWLLRQLASAPETLTVEALVARSKASLAVNLAAAREAPDALYPDANKEIRQFRLSLSRNLGLKRDSGRGSFIDSVMDVAETFYGDVLQHVRSWKAAPPRLKERPEEEQTAVGRVLEVVPKAAATIQPNDLESKTSSPTEDPRKDQTEGPDLAT